MDVRNIGRKSCRFPIQQFLLSSIDSISKNFGLKLARRHVKGGFVKQRLGHAQQNPDKHGIQYSVSTGVLFRTSVDCCWIVLGNPNYSNQTEL